MASHAIQALNGLYDWSVDGKTLIPEIERRPFKEYVSWKVPFSADLLEDEEGNRGLRAFCVDRVLMKLRLVADLASAELSTSLDFKAYSILTTPNLFGSEVGLVFSEEKWRKLVFRNFEQGNYKETTETSDLSLVSDFGVDLPEWALSQYMIHTIEDGDEEITFRGGFHVVWCKTSPATSFVSKM